VTTPDPYTQAYVSHDAQRLGVHLYPDPGDPAAPAVVIWPAMGVPARYYRSLAGHLAGHGLLVAVADLRGTGSSRPLPSRRSRYGLAELTGDVGAVLRDLSGRHAGRPLLLLGHSLGGQVALLHQALRRPGPPSGGSRSAVDKSTVDKSTVDQSTVDQSTVDQSTVDQSTVDSPTDGSTVDPPPDGSTVDGIVLVAVGLPYFRRYPPRRALAVLPYTQGIAAVAAVLRVWPGWGFGGRQARGVIRDWAYTARRGRYPRLGGTDPAAALARTGTPVLAVTVDGDRYTPPATTDHLLGLLGAAPVTRERYRQAEAGAPLDHFAWVRASAPLAARIARFAASLPGTADGTPGVAGPADQPRTDRATRSTTAFQASGWSGSAGQST